MLKKLAEEINLLKVADTGSLNEAFSEKNLEKVSNLVAQIFSKGGQGVFKPFTMEGWYKQSFKTVNKEKGIGYAFVSTKGYILRLGFVKRKIKSDKKFKADFTINTVSYWKPDGVAKFNKPSITVDLKPWVNIVESVQVIKDVIAGKITESSDLSISESKSYVPKKMISYMAFKGYDYDGENNKYQVVKKMGDDWDEQEYKGYSVTSGKKENNSMEETFVAAEKQLKEQKYADPDIIFEDVEKLTKVVGMGLQNSLIVVGDAGIGKCGSGRMEVEIKGL